MDKDRVNEEDFNLDEEQGNINSSRSQWEHWGTEATENFGEKCSDIIPCWRMGFIEANLSNKMSISMLWMKLLSNHQHLDIFINSNGFIAINMSFGSHIVINFY